MMIRTIILLTFITLVTCLVACSKKPTDEVETFSYPLPQEKVDFSSFLDVKQKKTAFFDFMFAYIVHANYEIKLEREFISNVDFSGKSISKEDSQKLRDLCNKYSKDCENLFTAKLKQELFNEINYIPAGLALAQAANESSWGTSRFATLGNNYFGQWCFKKGCGIVPSSRDENSNHEVRKFDSAFGSVKAYMFNINTHYAYEELRKIREDLGETSFDSLKLSEGLINYSQRKEEYIKELKAMINFNNLQEYDLKLKEILFPVK